MIQQKSCVWETFKAGAIEREFRKVSEVTKIQSESENFFFSSLAFVAEESAQTWWLLEQRNFVSFFASGFESNHALKLLLRCVQTSGERFSISPRGKRRKELNWSKQSQFICKSVCCYLFFSLAVSSLRSLDEFHGNLYWHISIITKLYNGACNFLLESIFISTCDDIEASHLIPHKSGSMRSMTKAYRIMYQK